MQSDDGDAEGAGAGRVGQVMKPSLSLTMRVNKTGIGEKWERDTHQSQMKPVRSTVAWQAWQAWLPKWPFRPTEHASGPWSTELEPSAGFRVDWEWTGSGLGVD